mgnify:CR=1 FL=1
MTNIEFLKLSLYFAHATITTFTVYHSLTQFRGLRVYTLQYEVDIENLNKNDKQQQQQYTLHITAPTESLHLLNQLLLLEHTLVERLVKQ